MLLGAGISKNSGLPLANQLMKAMMGDLDIESKYRDEITLKLPFEAFMEEMHAPRRVLEIFRGGEPNAAHHLIAELVKRGHLSSVFTTNFDLLLEKAFEYRNLESGHQFKVLWDEEDFQKASFDVGMTNLVKIHGSIHHYGSVRTTLNAVSARCLTRPRQMALEYLLSGGPHEKILVIGYSCSDEFDVNPIIKTVRAGKTVVVIQHENTSSPKVEHVSILDGKNPFKKYEGERVYCNTDDLINVLCELARIQERVAPATTNWRDQVRWWALEHKATLPTWDNSLMLGSLYGRLGITEKILMFGRKCLKEMENGSEEIQKVIVLPSLCAFLRSAGDNDSACRAFDLFFRSARQIAGPSLLDFDFGHEEKLNNLASIIHRIVDGPEAISGVDIKQHRAIFLHEFGVMVRDMGGTEGVRESVNEFKLALAAVRKETDEFQRKKVQADIWMDLGEALERLGEQYSDRKSVLGALDAYLRSAEISKRIGYLLASAQAYYYRGALWVTLYRTDMGIPDLRRCHAIAKSIGNSGLQAESCAWLGRAYHQLVLLRLRLDPDAAIPLSDAKFLYGELLKDPVKNSKKAEKFYSKAIRLYDSIGDKERAWRVEERLLGIRNLRKESAILAREDSYL